VSSFNTNPSQRELLIFGILPGLFLGIVGAVLAWRFALPRTAVALWSAGAVITVVFYALPAVRRPLYLGWMYGAMPIGWLVTHLLLGAIYFLVLTPLGLVMRLLGRDALRRRLDRAAPTCWVEHRPDRGPERYFRQF
jgi:hypothetical protein